MGIPKTEEGRAKLMQDVAEEIFAVADHYQNSMSPEDLAAARNAYGLGDEAIALAMGHATVATDIMCSLHESRKGFDSEEQRDAMATGAFKGFMYAYAWMSRGAPPPVVLAHFKAADQPGESDD